MTTKPSLNRRRSRTRRAALILLATLVLAPSVTAAPVDMALSLQAAQEDCKVTDSKYNERVLERGVMYASATIIGQGDEAAWPWSACQPGKVVPIEFEGSAGVTDPYCQPISVPASNPVSMRASSRAACETYQGQLFFSLDISIGISCERATVTLASKVGSTGDGKADWNVQGQREFSTSYGRIVINVYSGTASSPQPALDWQDIVTVHLPGNCRISGGASTDAYARASDRSVGATATIWEG